MAQRILRFDAIGGASIGEEHRDRVADAPLRWVEIISRVLRVLDDLHHLAEPVDPRVASVLVVVVFRAQISLQQCNGDHVLEAVVAVGRVVEGTALADDPDGRLLGGDDHPVDLVEPVAHLAVQRQGALHRGLGVEFGGKGDLEQDVLHHV